MSLRTERFSRAVLAMQTDGRSESPKLRTVLQLGEEGITENKALKRGGNAVGGMLLEEVVEDKGVLMVGHGVEREGR